MTLINQILIRVWIKTLLGNKWIICLLNQFRDLNSERFSIKDFDHDFKIDILVKTLNFRIIIKDMGADKILRPQMIIKV